MWRRFTSRYSTSTILNHAILNHAMPNVTEFWWCNTCGARQQRRSINVLHPSSRTCRCGAPARVHTVFDRAPDFIKLAPTLNPPAEVSISASLRHRYYLWTREPLSYRPGIPAPLCHVQKADPLDFPPSGIPQFDGPARQLDLCAIQRAVKGTKATIAYEWQRTEYWASGQGGDELLYTKSAVVLVRPGVQVQAFGHTPHAARVAHACALPLSQVALPAAGVVYALYALRLGGFEARTDYGAVAAAFADAQEGANNAARAILDRLS